MGSTEFLESCAEVRKTALSFHDPLVVHHYDADGLSSGAIVAGSLMKEGRRFRRECIRKLDDTAIDRYLREPEVIFVDLGGGNRRVDELKDVVIIDHHQTAGIGKPQANPLLFGLDGGTELSASGTAYCVFRRYPDLAIVGAVGDMQSPLHGMNRWVLEQGVALGQVKAEEDLRFYGRHCRPLVQFLAYSDDPYIPGISYREDRAAELLRDLGIPIDDGKRVYADLSAEEKTILISALAKILISGGRLKDGADMIGEGYVFPERPRNETYEAGEFSTLLNACGRHSKPEIGVRVCLGDEAAYAEARALLAHHRRMLREGISYASGAIQDLGAFFLLDGRGIIDEGIIGVVIGMSMQQAWKKPVIGISSSENGTLKISGREPKSLSAKGLDLGGLMKEATEAVGGVGGGHRIAAGASIPADKLDEFLLFAGSYMRKSSIG
ncbi:MAG: DHH family phosphoesterase [Candidatus Micrarchaeia archaeon]